MEARGTLTCPKCFGEVRAGWKVCPNCALPLERSAGETATVYLKESSAASPTVEGRFPAGTILAGRYRVIGLLGRGGMGEVYRATDLILNQAVALKFLSEAHVSDAALARLRNEVRVARQVSHPNVCRVYDIGFVEGQHFISMEYLDGEDLESLLRRIGRLSPDKASEFARRICAGLSAAHERGVLHRDLKPANIMIDARGNVQIADFGLAALTHEIAAGDVRSGTPAYMSPEQKAGKEVTLQSDLYSLGLVLYEMFTGRRRTDSHTSSALELVKELDPAIDRVIRRCLEDDPKRRPPSALNVAVALSGGDLVATALAAGEMPTPEMIAASSEKEGFSAPTAAWCFAGVVAAMLFAAFYGRDASVTSRARLNTPPEALAYRAREVLKRLGYLEDPARTAYGFDAWDRDYLALLARRDRATQNRILQAGRPAVVGFWYRQHRTDFWVDSFLPGPEIGNDVVSYDLPSNTEPGMIRTFLDPQGRLLQLEVRPLEGQPSASPESTAADWRQLFAEADLKSERFKPTLATLPLLVAADVQMAWTGTFAEAPEDTVRVDAAWWRGRPIFFDVRGPWRRGPQLFATASPAQPETPAVLPALVLLTVVSVLGGAALAARYNLRHGRGDRKGATQIAGLAFITSMFFWALSASHVVALWELHLTVKALSTAAFASGLVWFLYLAIEPMVRRNWPDALISWTRLQRYRVRDPLVASHVLAGTAVISIFIGLRMVRFRLSPLTMPMGFFFTSLNSMAVFIGNIAGSIVPGLVFGMAFVLLVVLVRLRIRRLWVADLVASTLLTLGAIGPANVRSGGLLIGTAMLGIAMNLAILWTLRRFGFLSVLVTWILWQMSVAAPISLTSWYSGRSVTLLAIPVVLSAWALWVIGNAQPPSIGKPRP
jgi:hypothetical protein